MATRIESICLEVLRFFFVLFFVFNTGILFCFSVLEYRFANHEGRENKMKNSRNLLIPGFNQSNAFS